MSFKPPAGVANKRQKTSSVAHAGSRNSSKDVKESLPSPFFFLFFFLFLLFFLLVFVLFFFRVLGLLRRMTQTTPESTAHKAGPSNPDALGLPWAHCPHPVAWLKPRL